MISGPMKALLGVLAVAGYQNRDKLGELLRGVQNQQSGASGGQLAGGQPSGGQSSGGLGDMLGGLTGRSSGGMGGLGGLLGGMASGGVLSGGLGDLLKTFQQNGHGETAESWVQTGPNKEIDHQQLSQALGPDVLKDLSERTGLSSEDILSRLTRDLPKAVDDLTPNGSIPMEK